MRGRRMMPTGGGSGGRRRPQSKGQALIAGVRWLIGCCVPNLSWLFRSVFKLILRTVTGRGEVERILTAGHHTPQMTQRFTKYLRESKRLGDVRNMVFRSRAKFSVEQATTMIIARKAIKPESAHFRTRLLPNLAACLTELNGTNAALGAAELQRITQFGPAHEPLLAELWTLLIDDPMPGRVTAEWKRIGFQGTDPVSDFRGNGMLGLHNLVYFARTFNAVCRSIVGNYDSPAALPLAITSINMTTFVMDLVQSRVLDTYFNSLGEVDDPAYALDMFNKVFGLVFVLFPPFFRASNPRDLMDFPRIYGHFRTALQAELEQTRRIPESLAVA